MKTNCFAAHLQIIHDLNLYLSSLLKQWGGHGNGQWGHGGRGAWGSPQEKFLKYSIFKCTIKRQNTLFGTGSFFKYKYSK